jgi:hypothetical protein
VARIGAAVRAGRSSTTKLLPPGAASTFSRLLGAGTSSTASTGSASSRRSTLLYGVPTLTPSVTNATFGLEADQSSATSLPLSVAPTTSVTTVIFSNAAPRAISVATPVWGSTRLRA